MDFTVQVLVILVTCNFSTFAIDMVGCGDSSPLEVRENTQNYVINCNNIGGMGRTVSWDRKAGTGAGNCVTVNDCQSSVSVIAMLSRPSYSTSTMTVKSATRALWGNKTVRCYTTQPPSAVVAEEDSCTLDVVYPAEASCSVQTNRWTVGGSCSVSKAYSSASRYSCQFFTGLQSSQTTPVTQPTPYTPQPHQDPDYRTGSCDFSNVALSPTKGDYYYKAVIVPGNVQKVFGPVTVDPPTKPSITCTPSSWVPDGSTVRCTCSTSNLGQPAGKVQGFRGSSMVAQGSDDGSLSLTLPAQTVNRGDHGNSKAQFSCAVDWIQDKTSDTHNIPVAWGPASVTIPQSTIFVTDSKGTKQLTLTCIAIDVNPTGDLLTYSWTGHCQGNTGNTCTFRPRPPGDDGMEVTCTVTNSYNNNQQRSYTFHLNLNYPPPQAPVITRSPSSQPLYSTHDLTLTCEVTGGKPLVTFVSLSCSSRHPDNPNDVKGSDSISSSLQMTLTDDDDGITCSCTAVWKVTSFYTLSDSITLSLYSPVSSTHLTLNSKTGVVTVYENDAVDVVMECRASGRPTPTLVMMDDQDRERKRYTGGAVSNKTESMLVYTLSAVRCEDSGTYTCVANNGAKVTVTSSATLRVLCNMRVVSDSFSSKQDGEPVIPLDNGQGKIAFQVLASALPRTDSFLKLRNDSSVGKAKPPRVGLFSVQCNGSFASYRWNCVIKVANATDNDLGHYTVTLETETETVTFNFSLQHKGNDTRPMEDREAGKETAGNDGPGFGAGLGVGMAIPLLVVCGCLIWLWRRQWMLPCSPNAKKEQPAAMSSSIELSSEHQVPATPSPYDDLRHEEIGLQSHYDVIGQRTEFTASKK